ncbi:MAG: ribonuclease III family protein [Candidatus Heimdallarchaeaceae archaeon]
MSSPFFLGIEFEEILSNKNIAKFGDSIVNFIYNVALFEALQRFEGIKVWDKCLAQACQNSPLRKYVGNRKDKGALGDAVEAFIAYLYIKNNKFLQKSIKILSNFIAINYSSFKTSESRLCSEAFTHLLNTLWSEFALEKKS